MMGHKSKKSTAPSFIQKLQPLNQEKEKAKFLFDPGYNPQFLYRHEISPEDLLRYGPVDSTYFEIAEKILQLVIDTFGNEENYLQATKGKILTKSESADFIQEFLKKNELSHDVKLSFSANYSARTALKKVGSSFVLQIRTPINYREEGLLGMLHHEIGTHLFRWLNEMQQPWYQNRQEYGLNPHFLTTEEGLASINNVLIQSEPYLWSQALNYYLVNIAAHTTFSELNKTLKKYITDPERRWRYCLKVKRGIEDTSTQAVFSKNQIYFIGTVEVLRWLLQNNYDIASLYLGKIALEDVNTARTLATQAPSLPSFILHNENALRANIDRIVTCNQLQAYLH